MTEEEYFASEFTDDFLHSQADAGDFHLEENGYNCMPTQAEILKMVEEGEAILHMRNLRKGTAAGAESGI